MDRARGARSLAPREDFPLLKKRNYINSAAIGLVPLPVQEEVQAFTRLIGSEGDLGYFNSLDRIALRPHAAAAGLFGCRAEDVFLTSSISEAMCDLAWSILPEAGQNVVCVDVDIACTTLPWLRISELTGVEVRFVHVCDDISSLCTEKVVELIDEKTSVVCVSHVQWLTGHMLDIAAISAAAHAYGAIVMVDGMHTVGTMPLDVVQLDVDMMVHGSYKWLGSYAGLAAAYIKPELRERLRPSLVGSNTPYMPPPYTKADPTKLVYCPGAGAFEYASGSHTAKVSYAAAARYLLMLGLDNVQEHIGELTAALVRGLELLGARIITPCDPKRRSGVVMAQFPGIEIMPLYQDMEKAGVQVSCRLDGLRFSPGVFNTTGDVGLALDILETLLHRAGYRG